MAPSRKDPSAADREDAELADRASAGDHRAAEELVLRHWDALHRVAHLIVRDRQVAEDLTQEAMIGALTQINGFDRRRAIRPWLVGIVTNRAIDWTRRRPVRPDAALVGGGAEEPATEDRPGGEHPDLRAALERLDPQTRALLVLRYVLDYRSPEIGELVGLSAEGVRTRLRRALNTLRITLGKENE